MDSFNYIQLLPSQHTATGKILLVHPDCSLDDLFRFPETPAVIKKALEKMVSWHTRNENSIAQALKSRHRFPQLQAIFLGLGYAYTDAGIEIPLPDTFLHCTVSDVRATPADEPIVSAIVGVEIDSKRIIKAARIIFCGADGQSPYPLSYAGSLVGQSTTIDTIDKIIKSMSDELKPRADYQGSTAYRMAMAAITLKRAWTQCVEEIQND